jgi:hypothetical protein
LLRSAGDDGIPQALALLPRMQAQLDLTIVEIDQVVDHSG